MKNSGPSLQTAANIFVTGSAGFVGVHLLREVASRCTAHIYCLVRARSQAAGRAKIFANMALYQLDMSDFQDRITIVTGDLSHPDFGVEKILYRTLCEEIDLVFHAGALNNWLMPYTRLAPTNVTGTAHVIDFVRQGKSKTLHHFSSTAVFMSLDALEFGYLGRTYPVSSYQRHVVGYFESKWAGELLVHRALDDWMAGTIHRPSFIGGSRQAGFAPRTDLTNTFLAACFELNAVPDLDLLVDIVPVDVLVKAVANLAEKTSPTRRDYNLCNPNGVPLHALRAMASKAGRDLELVPFSQWRAGLGTGPPSAAKQIMSLLCRPIPGVEDGVFAHLSRIQNFDPANIDTHSALAGTGVECPPVDLHMFNAHIANFV